MLLLENELGVVSFSVVCHRYAAMMLSAEEPFAEIVTTCWTFKHFVMNLALCTRLLLHATFTPASRKIAIKSEKHTCLPMVISLALIAHFVYDAIIGVVSEYRLTIFIPSIFAVLTCFEIEKYEGFLEFLLLSCFILLRFGWLHEAILQLVICILVDYLVTRTTFPLEAFVLSAHDSLAFLASFAGDAHCILWRSFFFPVRSRI